MISRASMKQQMKGNRMKTKKMNKGGKTTQKQLNKAAKYRSSVAYQNKNAPKSKGMDYLKDLPGTLSKDMAQVKKIRKNAARVAAGDPIAEKKYGTGKRTGTNMDKYVKPSTDGSLEFRSKTTKINKKKPVIKKNIGKMLETFSPAYSVMKGKGPISGALSALGKTGMSPIGSLALDKREEAKKRQMAMAAGRNAGKPGNNRMAPMEKMMAGGPVKRKRSIDGCAMKGKTRAK